MSDFKENKSPLVELVNKLFRIEPNEQVIKSLKGEIQVPPQNIVNNFIPNMKELIKRTSKKDTKK